MCIVRTATLMAAVFVGLTAMPVHAYHNEGPCTADAERLCREVEPGGGRVEKCLRAHRGELSDACKDHILRTRAEGQERYRACVNDIGKFCKGVERGGGRLKRCLQEHEKHLSTACKAEVGEERRE